MINLNVNLDKEQEMILNDKSKTILVMGAAGSGKTTLAIKLAQKRKRILLSYVTSSIMYYKFICDNISVDTMLHYLTVTILPSVTEKIEEREKDSKGLIGDFKITDEKIIDILNKSVGEDIEYYSVETHYERFKENFFEKTAAKLGIPSLIFRQQIDFILNNDLPLEYYLSFDLGKLIFSTETRKKIYQEYEDMLHDLNVNNIVPIEQLFNILARKDIHLEIFDKLDMDTIIVDEIQDLTITQFKLFFKFKNVQKIFFGDERQVLYPQLSCCEHFDIKSPFERYYILKGNYRTPSTVENIGNFFRNKYMEEKRKIEYNSTDKAVFKKFETPKDMFDAVGELIKKYSNDILIVNLDTKISTYELQTEKDSKKEINSIQAILRHWKGRVIGFYNRNKIMVDRVERFGKGAIRQMRMIKEDAIMVNAFNSKGLEFKYVIVINGQLMPGICESWNDEEKAKLLYTVCSRASEKLFVFSVGGFNKLFRELISNNIVKVK